MKKILIFVLSIVCCIVFTACTSLIPTPQYPFPPQYPSSKKDTYEVGVGVDQNGRLVKVISRPFNYEEYYYGIY